MSNILILSNVINLSLYQAISVKSGGISLYFSRLIFVSTNYVDKAIVLDVFITIGTEVKILCVEKVYKIGIIRH